MKSMYSGVSLSLSNPLFITWNGRGAAGYNNTVEMKLFNTFFMAHLVC